MLLQEKRGFFFCLEERALLCRDCDVAIHTANTLSCNHKRFLVPGTRVALEELKDDHPQVEPPKISPPEVVALSSLPSTPSSTVSSQSSPSSHYCRTTTTPTQGPRNASNNNNQTGSAPLKAPVYRDPAPLAPCCPPYSSGNLQQNAHDMKMNSEFRAPPAPQLASVPGTGTMKKSSISEFLTAAVPGWRVDELLNFPEPTTESGGLDFNASSAKAVDAAGGDYDWTAELSFFEEHMFAMHEVPQFPPATPVAALPRSMRGAPRNSRNSGKLQDVFLNAHGSSYDDAFIVPDIRMPSGPVSPPLPKRFKRDLYHI